MSGCWKATQACRAVAFWDGAVCIAYVYLPAPPRYRQFIVGQTKGPFTPLNTENEVRAWIETNISKEAEQLFALSHFTDTRKRTLVGGAKPGTARSCWVYAAFAHYGFRLVEEIT